MGCTKSMNYTHFSPLRDANFFRHANGTQARTRITRYFISDRDFFSVELLLITLVVTKIAIIGPEGVGKFSFVKAYDKISSF